MAERILIAIFILLLRLVVFLYTYITLPFYYFRQKPWIVLEKANRKRAKKENPSDPNSAYITSSVPFDHPILKSNTLSESFSKLCELFGSNSNALAYREVEHSEDSIGKDGKPRNIDGRTLKKYVLSDYKWLSYQQVNNRVRNIANGLTAIGVKNGDKVLILCETRLEWFLTAQAIIRVGATIVTLFTNLGDEGLLHGMKETKIKLMIASLDLMPKVRTLLDKPETKSISTIIYIKSKTQEFSEKESFPERCNILSLEEVEQSGNVSVAQFQSGQPDDPILIMYTSGTTGTPKAAVATHRNILSSFRAQLGLVKELVDDYRRHRYIAYLPLAHVLELTVELFLFHAGVKIGYGTPFTLTSSAPGLVKGQECDIKLLRPTCITTVPLVLDRIRVEIGEKLSAKSSLSVGIFNCLMAYKIKWTKKGYKCPFVNRIICKKVRQQMGGQLKYIIVGGAPLNGSTQALIKAALDVTLVQGYGATETTGAVMCMDFDDLSNGRVGAPLQGIKVKLIDWDEGGYHNRDKPNPRGELLIGGNNVTNGYFQLQKETDEAFKVDEGVRWFSTGDIGEMFSDGTYKIIDRRKDLIKLQNGEYVALGKIEAALKTCEYVENICVCGGSFSNNLIAIISPNQKSLTELSLAINKKDLPFDQLCNDSELNQKVLSSLVNTAVKNNLSRKEIPNKIIIVPDVWTPENQLLTAAMKMKRKNVETKYRVRIDKEFRQFSDHSDQHSIKIGAKK